MLTIPHAPRPMEQALTGELRRRSDHHVLRVRRRRTHDDRARARGCPLVTTAEACHASPEPGTTHRGWRDSQAVEELTDEDEEEAARTPAHRSLVGAGKPTWTRIRGPAPCPQGRPTGWPTAWSGRASKTKDWRSTSTTRRDEAPQGRTRDVPKVQRRAQRVKVGFSRSAVSGSLSHSSSRNKGTSVDRARRTSSVDRSRTRLGSRAAVTSAGSKWAPLA